MDCMHVRLSVCVCVHVRFCLIMRLCIHCLFVCLFVCLSVYIHFWGYALGFFPYDDVFASNGERT